MSTTIGDRLKTERLRLELSQEKFAELCGVKKRAQIYYETSERSPDLDYVEALIAAKTGADLRFIIEGKYTYEEIGERLRLERTNRLKLNTKGMAELGQITPELQNEYEQGLKQPPADYLNRIAKAGAETWYILTGERATNDPLLTPKEQELLNAFRQFSTDMQNAILVMASNSLRNQGEKV